MAGSLGLAMLTILLFGLANSPEDPPSSSERVAIASLAVETTTTTDAGGATDSESTSGGATDSVEGVDNAELVATGEGLATTNGCVACHSNNGTDGIGPTWSGLFGSERPLIGGGSAIADDAYLLESLVNPGAQVVDGFLDGIMPPTYGDSLATEDIDALFAYIKSL
jgi:mono/diheme cytochrome c family protein